jgi:glycosyltransferase involved in cell wall biosynthesis
VRVLVVTNMLPSVDRPALGSFVRDQVSALERLGVEIERFDFAPGSRRYLPATLRLRSLLRRRRFDVVHAHYGLAGWCAALAGAAPLLVTFHGTDVRHRVVGPLSRRLVRRLDVVAAASRALFAPESERPGLPRLPGRDAVLPCGPDLSRFSARPRAEARRRLGLDQDGRYLLLPTDPARAVKRADRAWELAQLTGAELLTAGAIDPAAMPDWINAANAVLVTSDNEGFGLAVLEALACDVPVLSTPVGVAPLVLAGLEGCLVGAFDGSAWGAHAGPLLDDPDPRVAGRERAEHFSSVRTAQRVAVVYRELVDPAAAALT